MKRLLLVLVFVLTSAACFAEIIVTKSGNKFEAKIVETTATYIKVNFDGSILTYYLDQLQSIDGKKIADFVNQAGAKKEPSQVPGVAKAPEKEPVKASVNAGGFLEQVKLATRNVNRQQIKTTKDMELPKFLHIKTESIFDVNFDQKIIYLKTQVKEYDFYFKEFLKSFIEKEIAKAEKSGSAISPGTRQMMENQVYALTQKMLDKVTERMKSTSSEIIFLGKNMYMNSKEKWFKMEYPFLPTLWDIMLRAKEGKASKEEFKMILEQAPITIKQTIEPLFLQIGLESSQDIYDTTKITEGIFAEKPCYVLDVKERNMLDAVKRGLLSFAQARGNAKFKVSTKSVDFKDYFSKKDYLRLGSKLNIELLFLNEEQKEQMQARAKQDAEYSYPSGDIQLPKEYEKATVVKDEAELRSILKQDIVDDLKPASPSAPAK